MPVSCFVTKRLVVWCLLGCMLQYTNSKANVCQNAANNIGTKETSWAHTFSTDLDLWPWHSKISSPRPLWPRVWPTKFGDNRTFGGEVINRNNETRTISATKIVMTQIKGGRRFRCMNVRKLLQYSNAILVNVSRIHLIASSVDAKVLASLPINDTRCNRCLEKCVY